MTAVSDLVSALEAERDAILAGDLHQLPALTERKLRLIRQLSEIDEQAALPNQLKTAALRNVELLQAAAHGIKSAITRLDEIRSATCSTTYDAKGARNRLTAEEPARETRV